MSVFIKLSPPPPPSLCQEAGHTIPSPSPRNPLFLHKCALILLILGTNTLEIGSFQPSLYGAC